jgi:hypothetical protein
MTGMWLALMVIATARAFGLLWRARQVRVRSASKLPPPQSQGSGTPSWTSPSTRSWPAC